MDRWETLLPVAVAAVIGILLAVIGSGEEAPEVAESESPAIIAIEELRELKATMIELNVQLKALQSTPQQAGGCCDGNP